LIQNFQIFRSSSRRSSSRRRDSSEESGSGSDYDSVDKSTLPVGGKAAVLGAKRGDTFIRKHPEWATATLADLSVDRAGLRNQVNVSKNLLIQGYWG
jgi:hypothetical protein